MPGLRFSIELKRRESLGFLMHIEYCTVALLEQKNNERACKVCHDYKFLSESNFIDFELQFHCCNRCF